MNKDLDMPAMENNIFETVVKSLQETSGNWHLPVGEEKNKLRSLWFVNNEDVKIVTGWGAYNVWIYMSNMESGDRAKSQKIYARNEETTKTLMRLIQKRGRELLDQSTASLYIDVLAVINKGSE